MSVTLDENGKALTETQEGVTMPINYTFANINDYVHGVDAEYENLQCLCLGMANHIEDQDKIISELRAKLEDK